MTSSSTAPGVESHELQVKMLWPEDAMKDAQVVNHVLLADGQGGGVPATGGQSAGAYFVFGHLAPPVWLGDPEKIEAFKQAGAVLSIESRGSFFASRDTLEAFWQTLGQFLGK